MFIGGVVGVESSQDLSLIYIAASILTRDTLWIIDSYSSNRYGLGQDTRGCQSVHRRVSVALHLSEYGPNLKPGYSPSEASKP